MYLFETFLVSSSLIANNILIIMIIFVAVIYLLFDIIRCCTNCPCVLCERSLYFHLNFTLNIHIIRNCLFNDFYDITWSLANVLFFGIYFNIKCLSNIYIWTWENRKVCVKSVIFFSVDFYIMQQCYTICKNCSPRDRFLKFRSHVKNHKN